jgi:hypothetical protein
VALNAHPARAAMAISATNTGNTLGTLTVQPPTVPQAASGVAGLVSVSWTASTTAATRLDVTTTYLVFRRPSGPGVFTQVNANPGTTLVTYNDTPPADGLYDYAIQTVMSSFTSPLSIAVSGLSDRVPPTTSITCDTATCAAAYVGSVAVVISATDAGSGVASISYTLDGATTVTAGASVAFTVSNQAVHTISYFATDVAGNASVAQSVSFTNN